MAPFGLPFPAHGILALMFVLSGCLLMASLGLIAGIWAEKFDQLAAFQNFLIMPLTFLSGVFYSLHSLPTFWQTVSHVNPIFYLIDGFRYAFFGVSDTSPTLSLAITWGFALSVSAIAYGLLRKGWKLQENNALRVKIIHESVVNVKMTIPFHLTNIARQSMFCHHKSHHF